MSKDKLIKNKAKKSPVKGKGKAAAAKPARVVKGAKKG